LAIWKLTQNYLSLYCKFFEKIKWNSNGEGSMKPLGVTSL